MLRRLYRGHDIKSIARELSISLTAANERLRSARQKLGVSSSREAARILATDEGEPNFSGDGQTGVSNPGVAVEGRGSVFVWIGVVMAVAVATTIGLMAVLGTHAGASAAPKVVRSSPSANAEIAPGTFTLSVTFDRAMADGSFSFVQKSPDTFPQCEFPAHLSPDKRTFTVRCRAEPSRNYEIWFNSPPYMNFKGADGVPAEPHRLLFSTKPR